MKRYITQASAEGIHEEIGPESLRAWGANFAPNAARRMTRLGLLLGHAFREFSPGPEDAVVYATTFAEAFTTERYLAGFPTASPLFFQTSIHPSAIEQVLINRTLPVRELTPMAGREEVGAQAMMTALLTPADTVFLTGGEELGTWLGEIGACSPVAFAFALQLTREGDDEDAGGGSAPLGEISWSSEVPDPGQAGAVESDDDASRRDLRALFSAIRERRSLRWPGPGGGTLEVVWF